ncbi:MAG: LysM peptidoglycan-binding domain-containing protein [Pedosphaera sp.]|nr:LysM peptidoglycan-binding domain-containing protein [Pedosphaera sp.]
MSTHNPLTPLDSKLERAARSKSTLSIATFIIGAHAAVFLGLLAIGCNKETVKTDLPATTPLAADLAVQQAAPINSTNLTPPVAQNDPPVYVAPVAPPLVAGTNIRTTPTPVEPKIIGDPVGQVGQVQPPQIPVESSTAPSSEYTVKSGDIAFNIAKKNGFTLKALKEANPAVDIGRLKVGQKINLPSLSSALAKEKTETAGDFKTPTESTSSTVSYTVKGGDTLSKIAKKHGTSTKTLRASNELASDVIKVGQKLKISSKASASAEATTVPSPSTKL